jgi:putative flippase GtrA
MSLTADRTSSSMRFTDRSFVRFLFWGALNTLLTYLIYLGALTFVGYGAAYTLTFIVGVVIGYSLYSRFVFRRAFSWKKMVRFPLVYLAQYAFGMSLMWLLIDGLGWNARIAPIAVIILSVPVSYLLTRQFS